MLGLDWTELALIAVVAVVVIGPKDLPEAVRGIAKGVQKLRRMAGEFQGQLDEVVREAKLEDVRQQINDIRNFDFRGAVEREIDKDGSIRKTFTEDPIGNPLKDAFDTPPPPAQGATVTPPPEPAVTGDTASPAGEAATFGPPVPSGDPLPASAAPAPAVATASPAPAPPANAPAPAAAPSSGGPASAA